MAAFKIWKYKIYLAHLGERNSEDIHMEAQYVDMPSVPPTRAFVGCQNDSVSTVLIMECA